MNRSGKNASRISRILFNSTLLLILLTAGAVREGSLLGIRIHGSGGNSVTAYRAQAPSEKELRGQGFSGILLQKMDRGIWALRSRSGERVGVVISTAAYDRTAGYAGPIPMRIWLDSRMVVRSIVLLPNNETPSFIKRLMKSGFLDNWIGKSAAQIRERHVDTVSGATMSSRAVILSISRSISALIKKEIRLASMGKAGFFKTAAVVLVLLAAVFFAFHPGRHHRFRSLYLLVNVAVLGFWAGQFLSLSAVFGWLKSGGVPLAGLALLAGAGLLVPLLGRPLFFCTWVCPYGALQELAGKVFRKKWHIPPGLTKYLRRVRDGILLLLLILIWAGAGSAVLNYEPFSAFLFRYASTPVLVLAVCFLVLSFFIHRPWCRFFCPTGSLISRMSGNQRW